MFYPVQMHKLQRAGDVGDGSLQSTTTIDNSIIRKSSLMAL
jgi:hypothetical protein